MKTLKDVAAAIGTSPRAIRVTMRRKGIVLDNYGRIDKVGGTKMWTFTDEDFKRLVAAVQGKTVDAPAADEPIQPMASKDAEPDERLVVEDEMGKYHIGLMDSLYTARDLNERYNRLLDTKQQLINSMVAIIDEQARTIVEQQHIIANLSKRQQ